MKQEKNPSQEWICFLTSYFEHASENKDNKMK